VIGIVTGSVEYLGDMLAYIAENIIWIVAAMALIFALLTLLKVVFNKEKPSETAAV